MKPNSIIWLLVSALLLLCHCHHFSKGHFGRIHRDGFVLERAKTEEAFDELRRRAAFDMNCSPDRLNFTVLAVHDDAGPDMPKQIGVRGCGKQATYTKEYIDDFESGWKLDMAGIDLTGEPSGPRQPGPK